MQQHLTTQAVVYSAKSDAEKSFDYILPEYLPGISRIVRVSTAVEKCTFFAGMGGAGAEICIKMCIIYISEYDGRIKSTSFREEFSVPFREIFDFTGEFTAVPSCFVSSTSAFIQSPRKLSAKLLVKASVTVYAEKQLPLFSGSDDENICMLKNSVESYSKKILPEAHFEKTEEITLDSAKTKVDEIIHTDAQVINTSAKVSEAEVCFEADTALHILYESFDEDKDEASYSYFDTVVKIDGSLPCGAVNDGDMPFIYIDILSAEPSVSLDAYGENKLISLMIKYSVSGFVYSKKECELVTDAFIKNCLASPEFSTVEIDTVHNAVSKKEVISQTVRADIRDIADISACSTRINSVSVEHSEGQFFAVAKCLSEVLGTNISGELLSAEAPVVIHIPLGGENLVPSDTVPEVIINITGCSALIKDGGLKLDFEISANGVFVTRTRQKLVSALSASDTNSTVKKKGEIKVYYPSKDESLWDIAKKYRVGPKDICSANGIDEKSLAGRHTLIIP